MKRRRAGGGKALGGLAPLLTCCLLHPASVPLGACLRIASPPNTTSTPPLTDARLLLLLLLQGPPAPGHTDDSERPVVAGPAFTSHDDELVEAPPVLGRSKYLAQEAEDPFAEGGAGSRSGKKKAPHFDEIALG